MAISFDIRLNLAVLQRIDSSITAIVDSASQVALYKFTSESKEWEKTEIEGTLFVYTRSKKPQHGFVIVNRVNTANFVEPITNKLEFQVQIPFVLYRSNKGNIIGIWFYEQEQCIKIGRLLKGLSELVLKQKQPIEKPKLSFSSNNMIPKKETNFEKMDIMSLLTRAQEEYDKRAMAQELPSSAKRDPQQPKGIVKPTPLRANGIVLTNGIPPVTLSIDTLFAKAGDGKYVYKGNNVQPNEIVTRVRSLSTTSTEDVRQIPVENAESILQKLMVNSSGGIEVEQKAKKSHPKKRARAATYSSLPVAANSNGKQASVESVEQDLMAKLNINPKCVPLKQIAAHVKSELPPNPELLLGAQIVTETEAIDIPILTPAMLELSSSVPDNNALPYGLKNNEKMCNNTFAASSSLPTDHPFPPPLFSPMDFKVSAKSSSPNYGESPPELDSSYINSSHCIDTDEDNDFLLLPKTLVQGAKNDGSNVNKLSLKPFGVTPLTKDQLREALSYMLQHDDEFISQIHDSYLKSLRSQLNGFKSS